MLVRSAQGGDPHRKPLKAGVFVFLALSAMAGLTALGVWQLERRVWKLALIENVERRVHAEPAPLPRAMWAKINARDDAYRRVVVTGRFLYDRETFVQAVTELGGGFWVMTPLVSTDGGVVLVNRGFVSPERRAAATRKEGDPAGPVRIAGLIRMSEPNGAFLRSNDPAAGRWYSRDVQAIAARDGLRDVAPFFIDADASPNPGGWPVGGLTVLAFRNHHLGYALTWFALALMAGGAAFLAICDHLRSRRVGDGEVGASSPKPDAARAA